MIIIFFNFVDMRCISVSKIATREGIVGISACVVKKFLHFVAARAFIILPCIGIELVRIFNAIFLHNDNLFAIFTLYNLVLEEVSLQFEVIEHLLNNVKQHISQNESSGHEP